MTPGTIRGLHLVVDNIDEACAELLSRDVAVTEIDDSNGGGVRCARFSDPDGIGLVPQEVARRTGVNY